MTDTDHLPVEDGADVADNDEDRDEIEADHHEAFAPDDDIEETTDPPPDEGDSGTDEVPSGKDDDE